MELNYENATQKNYYKHNFNSSPQRDFLFKTGRNSVPFTCLNLSFFLTLFNSVRVPNIFFFKKTFSKLHYDLRKSSFDIQAALANICTKLEIYFSKIVL